MLKVVALVVVAVLRVIVVPVLVERLVVVSIVVLWMFESLVIIEPLKVLSLDEYVV